MPTQKPSTFLNPLSPNHYGEPVSLPKNPSRSRSPPMVTDTYTILARLSNSFLTTKISETQRTLLNISKRLATLSNYKSRRIPMEREDGYVRLLDGTWMMVRNSSILSPVDTFSASQR